MKVREIQNIFSVWGKREYINKTMYKVRKKDSSITKDYREILNEQLEFYGDLYRSNPKIKFQLKNNSGIFLSQEDKKKVRPTIYH